MYEINTNELYHHGIKGQKWGVRRYQNKDGSYTSEGKKHISRKEMKARKAFKKEAEFATMRVANSMTAEAPYRDERQGRTMLREAPDVMTYSKRLHQIKAKDLTADDFAVGYNYIQSLKTGSIPLNAVTPDAPTTISSNVSNKDWYKGLKKDPRWVKKVNKDLEERQKIAFVNNQGEMQDWHLEEMRRRRGMA